MGFWGFPSLLITTVLICLMALAYLIIWKFIIRPIVTWVIEIYLLEHNPFADDAAQASLQFNYFLNLGFLITFIPFGVIMLTIFDLWGTTWETASKWAGGAIILLVYTLNTSFSRNVIAGLQVFLNNPAGAGEEIKTENEFGIVHRGKVHEIRTNATWLVDRDNLLVNIPNHEMAKLITTNYDRAPFHFDRIRIPWKTDPLIEADIVLNLVKQLDSKYLMKPADFSTSDSLEKLDDDDDEKYVKSDHEWWEEHHGEISEKEWTRLINIGTELDISPNAMTKNFILRVPVRRHEHALQFRDQLSRKFYNTIKVKPTNDRRGSQENNIRAEA